MSKKVAIALGGGGAKFFTHLGMIDVLKESNIPIDYLSCSSMGAIAGALVANGVTSEKIKKEFLKKRAFLSWLKPNFRRYGIFSQKRIQKILGLLLPQTKIEDSKIPLSIISTNILDGKIHVFREGDIKQAVCASCAFPGIFSPIPFEDKLLVDGGVVNNIPADICREYVGKSGFVISSSLDASLLCTREDIKTQLDVYQRIIYLPLYEKRLKIIRENSDLILDHFAHKKLSLKAGRDVFQVINKKAIEEFYEIGRQTTKEHLQKIKI